MSWDKDYNGHTVTVENWQIQELDGTPLADKDYPTNKQAVAEAMRLSKDYQVQLIVKRTA